MPRLHVLGLFLLIPPLFLAGCDATAATSPDAGLWIGDRDSTDRNPLGRCTPPACRIAFSLANAPAGRDGGGRSDGPWEVLKPSDAMPWIPLELR